MTKEQFEHLASEAQRVQSILANDPEVLHRVKQIAWWAVEYANKLEHKKITPGGLVRREYIDELVECDLGLREDITYNPYSK